jgi:hypothetical protein
VPGLEFAPAWVFWRRTDDYCGWAPLPPGAVFIEGGWRFRGLRVGVDFDFGLSVGFFTFVGYDHFWEHDFRHFIVPRERLALVFRRSVIGNHYRLVNGRFFHEGVGRERIAQLTHHDLRASKPLAVREIRAQEERRNIAIRHEDRDLAAKGHKVEAIRRVEERHPEAPQHPGTPQRPGAAERPPASGPGSTAGKAAAHDAPADAGKGAPASKSSPGPSSDTKKGQSSSSSDKKEKDSK